MRGRPCSTDDLHQLITDLGAAHSRTAQRMAVSAEAHSAFDALAELSTAARPASW